MLTSNSCKMNLADKVKSSKTCRILPSNIMSLQDASVKDSEATENLQNTFLRCGEIFEKKVTCMLQSVRVTSHYGEDFKKLQGQLDSTIETMEVATDLELAQ